MSDSEDHQHVRGSVSMALQDLRDNRRSAIDQIWQKYFPRLLLLARSTLRHLPHRFEDAEEAVQSAFVSFWQKLTTEGVRDVLDRNSLWRLLATMTARKAKQIVRKDFAQKRGQGAVVPFSNLTDEREVQASLVLQQLPAQEFDLACVERLNQLPEELRQFAVLRLFGHTNAEISKLLNCSERRVERKLKLIRSYWTNEEFHES